MKPPRTPLLRLIPPCSTSSRSWWGSSFLGWPSSRSPCPCLLAVLCHLLNSSRALLAAAWRTWDTVTTPSQIWEALALVGLSVWTQVLPRAAHPPCQLFSVHSALRRILPLEKLPAAPSLHLLTPITCCLHQREETPVVTTRETTEHTTCRYNVYVLISYSKNEEFMVDSMTTRCPDFVVAKSYHHHCACQLL